MLVWVNKYSAGIWNCTFKDHGEGEDEGFFFEQCAVFCLTNNGCNAILLIKVDNFNGRNVEYKCYINKAAFTTETKCSDCDSNKTYRMGVFKDYYEENPQALPEEAGDTFVIAGNQGS